MEYSLKENHTYDTNTDLLKSFKKNRDILDKYLLIPNKCQSRHDAKYAYYKCSRKDLEILVKRGDKIALVFYNCKEM